MKFASIYLSNYIGIYNGMGLYEIHIDMTKCKNRITIIRGDNGSGKSTISKAMNLFPDSSDSFIPGLSARKEIVLVDGDVLYKLVLVHNVKSNGEREPTKAYITKTFQGQAIELNENGNVSSYKDIIYNELGLDANFLALSQLSTEDRGLADKRPADRKKFVNSIISSLETYNNIYKTLSKRSSNFKSMINSIVAKLSVLGDVDNLKSKLENLESRINALQDKKDAAVADLAKAQSTISILDPDGSIRIQNEEISSELSIYEKEVESIKSIINGLLNANGLQGTENIVIARKALIERKNSLIIKNQIARNDLDFLISQREKEASELDEKAQRISSLQSGYNYETLKVKIESYKLELESIEQIFESIGIENAMKLSKEEYILALEILRDLETSISVFKSNTDFSILERIVTEYIESGNIPDRMDVRLASDTINSYNTELEDLQRERIVLDSKIGLLDQLNLRPSSCSIDSCPFISEALEFASTNPNDRIIEIDANITRLKTGIGELEAQLQYANAYNDAINLFSIIARSVDRNSIILAKMPNGDMFKNKILFFENLINGYSFEYMRLIYEHIELANLFDTYSQTKSIYDKYAEDLRSFESKNEIIQALSLDMDRINKSIDEIKEKMDPINQEILDRNIEIAQCQELEGVYDAIIDQLQNLDQANQKITLCRSKLLEISRKMNDINIAIAASATAKESINQSSYNLAPLMKERDQILHSISMIHDYMEEKEQLQNNYDFIETLKYYSSPTTGVQLIFMELYMGKIIALANELLGLLFGGQFAIQPFVINDSEFRIPCLGNGYLNDDISSMSSSQVSMISMIISFALLHHSSTKYNIIKLDEIDGPLDYNNRVYFMDVLNSIMDIMGTEQCIMISHNSELQVDNSDVILLRHDGNNTDYMRGNIIWRYQ